MANARARWRVAGMVVLSLALHGAAFGALAGARRTPARSARERIEIEVVRREPQAPPAIPPAAPPAAPRSAARRTAPANPPPPPIAKPLPPPAALPPAPAPAARPIPRVGISLGSTVSSGGIAVPVGNTLYGRPEETAGDPAAVRPLSGVVAAALLSAQPKPIDLPRIAYPADARKAGTEGRVVLVLRIDAQGRVASARVLDAPSASLAGAAREGARNFRFTPALRDGAPVETEIRFTYTFLLE